MTKCQQIFAPTRQICHLNFAHQPIASLITRPFPTSMPPPHSSRACFPSLRTPPHSLRARFPPPRTPPHLLRARFPPPRPRLTHYAPAFHLHAPPHSLHACFPSLRTPPHSLRARFPPPCAPDIYSTIKRQNFILKSENYIKTILLPNMAKPYLPRKGFHQLVHTIFPRLARHIKKAAGIISCDTYITHAHRLSAFSFYPPKTHRPLCRCSAHSPIGPHPFVAHRPSCRCGAHCRCRWHWCWHKILRVSCGSPAPKRSVHRGT